MRAAELIDADLETGALLLEKIEPGTKLSDPPEVPPASDMAELLTGLQRTPDVADGNVHHPRGSIELQYGWSYIQ